MKNQKGLSLVELVLSMTMLSIVMVGASTLETSVIRIQTGNYKNVDFHNQLAFAYRQMDLDFGNTSLVMIDAMPQDAAEAQLYQWRIRPNDAATDGTDDITYTLDLQSQTTSFKRTEQGVTEDLLPLGLVAIGSLTPPQSEFPLAMWTSPDLKFITFNIKMDTQAANMLSTPKTGYGKSFLVRTGNVMDCRSVACN